MLIRIITALVVLGLLLPAVIWLPAPGWSVLCGALSVWAAWEWGRLARLPIGGRLLYSGAIAIADFLLPGAAQGQKAVYIAAAVAWIFVAPLVLRSASRRPPGPPAALVLAAGLVALPAVFIALVQIRALGPDLLLATMAVVWISDSTAYFTGRAFGRHKLAPTVSPGKTWEGVAGALVAVAVYALWAHAYFNPARMPIVYTLVLFLALAVAGIVGDLIESLLKRWAGVKDSGAALPGHGGILDRVDALLPVLPLAALAYLHAGWARG